MAMKMVDVIGTMLVGASVIIEAHVPNALAMLRAINIFEK